MSFAQHGASELVMIDGEEVALVHQDDRGQFHYSGAVTKLASLNRTECIREGLRSDGYFIY